MVCDCAMDAGSYCSVFCCVFWMPWIVSLFAGSAKVMCNVPEVFGRAYEM